MAGPAAHSMEERDWSSLAYSIAHGYCILMLGPDAVTEQVGGRREPVLNRLSRELMKLTDAPGEFDETDYRAVAQAVLAKDLYALQATAVDVLSTVRIDDPTLAALASLPFRLVVNTAPGIHVEQVWRAVKPGTNSAYYDYRPRRALAPVPEPTVDAPLVYHLYGSVAEPSSLTLTESDLIELLVSIVAENPDLPRNLKSMLRSRQHTFLFLGFRLHQWHLRILLHVLAASDPQSHSYALQAVDTLDPGTRQFYREGHKIQFCDAGVEAFVAELASRVGQVAPGTPAASVPAPLAHEPATVFVCHAREDADVAAAVAAELRAAGFETWIDQDDLRGGDRWDGEIERAIDTVRYVVVLQSRHLAAKQEGYVNKEINLALRRQLTFRSDLRFVVPVVVDDDANVLECLAHLQAIELYAPNGFAQLRRALVRDQERAVKK